MHVLGRHADRHPNPLALYALLELSIAVTAAVSPLLIDLIRAIYVGLGGQLALGSLGATIVRLSLAALVLGAATVLMGGTLPAAVRAVTTPEDRHRRAVGLLHGATPGRVLGAAVSTLLRLGGVRTDHAVVGLYDQCHHLADGLRAVAP